MPGRGHLKFTRAEAKLLKYQDTRTTPCRPCRGGGEYKPGEVCFRCGGKGVQTPTDRRRNYWYDAYGIIK